ncbi:unnamed protein product [Paramecium sonneborni]|uniref:Uncharacterized protein n=1 Tax=Paramecium sonneborni TaxID=65129 RepID=A0A8S1LBW3_9CILI|nr:unnamed protein product [Paramecium sonneborni]
MMKDQKESFSNNEQENIKCQKIKEYQVQKYISDELFEGFESKEEKLKILYHIRLVKSNKKKKVIKLNNRQIFFVFQDRVQQIFFEILSFVSNIEFRIKNDFWAIA